LCRWCHAQHYVTPVNTAACCGRCPGQQSRWQRSLVHIVRRCVLGNDGSDCSVQQAESVLIVGYFAGCGWPVPHRAQDILNFDSGRVTTTRKLSSNDDISDRARRVPLPETGHAHGSTSRNFAEGATHAASSIVTAAGT
jgi:hypothetical protein